MNLLGRHRGTRRTPQTKPLNGELFSHIDETLGPKHRAPDPLLYASETIPIGVGKSLARPAHGGAHVRCDIPQALAGHRLKLRTEGKGTATRACELVYQRTGAGNPCNGLIQA